jgi:HAD superfamily hydrolase (TIGR01549 family)
MCTKAVVSGLSAPASFIIVDTARNCVADLGSLELSGSMPNEPRLVIFDLMGTLLSVRHRAPYWEALGRYLEQEGYCSCATFVARYTEWRRSRTPSLDELTLRDCVGRFVAASDAHLKELEAVFLREYAQGTSVMRGANEMLARWYGRAALGVVSNFFVAGVPRALLEAHQLLDYFEFVVDSAEVGVRKPHPAIFEYAVAKAASKQQPGDILMIGDDWNADVQGALALGWRAIHFSEVSERSEPVPVLRSWDDFVPG